MNYRETVTVSANPITRTITARLCNYDEPRAVHVPDGQFTETFRRGSLQLAERVHVTDDHTGNLIGRVVSMSDDHLGPTVTMQIAHTRSGDEILDLIDAGIINAVSMEFSPISDVWNAARTAVTRLRAMVHGVAFAFRPAHAAPILSRAAVAERRWTSEERLQRILDAYPRTPVPPVR